MASLAGTSRQQGGTLVRVGIGSLMRLQLSEEERRWGYYLLNQRLQMEPQPAADQEEEAEAET